MDNDSNIKYKIFLHPSSQIANFLINMPLSFDVSTFIIYILFTYAVQESILTIKKCFLVMISAQK